MRSASKRGRRSRPSSLALEEQEPLPLKRTRSAHSSPAAQPTRSFSNHSARRQDNPSRPLSSTTGGNFSRHSNTNNNESNNHKEPSPIPEAPSDEGSPPPMTQEPKAQALVETIKRRGSRDSKRPTTPQVPQQKTSVFNDDTHVSDTSSLSELEDSEAETERLEDSPRKGAPKSVFTYNQPANKPAPLKLSLDIKPTKSSDADLASEDADSQPAKKRKRDNGDTPHKEVKAEDKTSRPATPLTAKPPSFSEKGKKSKGTADSTLDKRATSPMEGVEAAPSPAPVNGDDSRTEDDHTEPDPPPTVETAAEVEIEDDSKNEPAAEAPQEAEDDTTESAEVSREEEEDAEKLQKRKAAMDALTQIELEFAKLRDKLYEERISDIEEEMRLVNEGTHPELLAMMEAVNKRRDDKIRLYNTQLKYSLQTHTTAMKATRAQLHSQYGQQVREIRERYLDRVSEGLYQIQRERRASDTLVQDYTYRISEDRATRIRERQAYNMEVQILAGIAKYIGFPAAPEVKGAAPSEMQQDLEAMGIVSRAPMRGGMSRGLDDYQDLPRSHWGNRTAPPSPPQTISQATHHHHHHHSHSHSHHHHMSHLAQDQSISQRRAAGTSTSIPNPATHMSPVMPLPLSALLHNSEPIKLEQAGHHTLGLHPPQSMSHANRSPLHTYRPAPPPQAHIHGLQHPHLHQSYGPRGSSLEPGESSLIGPERSRMMDDKEIGGLQPLGIARYAPVGKGYV
ncbi:Sds3-like-domain-containing protein [Kalaharituber pfeilii]|nr:Sds3-like-domain-containing protein [Kalaharituber pfeilii]